VRTGFENPDDICASFPLGVSRFFLGGVGVGGGATGVADGRGAATDESMFDERVAPGAIAAAPGP